MHVLFSRNGSHYLKMNVCAICYETIEAQETTFLCNHTFHTCCVDSWIEKKGTCPTCRYRVKIVDEDSDEDSDNEMEDQLFRIQRAVHEFWQRRIPHLPPLPFQEPVIPPSQPRHPEIESGNFQLCPQTYEQQVSQIAETETDWTYEINGLQGRSSKVDVALVQTQTDVSLPTILFALNKYENDIVNAIMDIADFQ